MTSNYVILVIIFAVISIFFETAKSSTICGGKIIITNDQTRGTISSRNYPNNYPDFTNCIWNFEAPEHYVMQLQIDALSGETGTDGCNDYLQINDGTKTSANIYKNCSISGTTTIQSTKRWMWVQFYANYEVTSTGFTATYSVFRTGETYGLISPLKVCGGHEFNCPNGECVSWSYLCDGIYDCGYNGPSSDEDFEGCSKTLVSKELFWGVAVSSGTLVFLLLVFCVLFIDGHFSSGPIRKPIPAQIRAYLRRKRQEKLDKERNKKPVIKLENGSRPPTASPRSPRSPLSPRSPPKFPKIVE